MKRSAGFKVGTKQIGQGELFFIIEEGQANNGDFRKALAMVEAAKSTGADAIEFQLARADEFYVKNNPGHLIYKKREFDLKLIGELVAFTRKAGLEFIAAPLSASLIDPLVRFGCGAFTVNASDINNPEIIDAVAGSGLPFFLALPLAAEEELRWALKRISRRKSARFSLLHGQHSMASGEGGVAVEHTSLGYLATLKRRYGIPIGFIDHTPFPWFSAVAAAAGAEIVTKHLALDRREKGPDWQICLEPDEMRRAVQSARAARACILERGKVLAPGEHLDKSVMRRSIVAARLIEAGSRIGRGDIGFKRPGEGLRPSDYRKVVGKIALRRIASDEPIRLTDVRGGK